MSSYTEARGSARRVLSVLVSFTLSLIIISVVSVAIASRSRSSSTAADECKSENLPLGNGGDLIVTGTCKVGPAGAGPYNYGVINILKGGTLLFTEIKDTTIDFWASSIVIETDGSMIAGVNAPNSNEETISPIGSDGGSLTIHLYGPFKGKNGTGVVCKSTPGNALNKCGVPEGIWGSNKPFVYDQAQPQNTCKSVSLPGGVTDCFYDYDTLANDDGEKDRFFGYKVLAVSYGATLRLYGLDGATYADTKDPATLNPQDSGMSWARLDSCPGNKTDTTLKCNKGVLQGESLPGKGDGAVTLTLDGPANRRSLGAFNGVNWKKNDQIVITTTDYLPGHTEVATIDSVSNCTGAVGSQVCKTIKIKSGLKFPHNASIYDLTARIPAGKGLTDLSAVDGRAAAGLLSRSISIVSGGDVASAPLPEPGQNDDDFGGHTVIRQGFKQVQIQGVQFFQMGQGGRIGHYPIHFHMARKVPKNTFIKDSTIWDSMTRFIVLHATQDVLLARNVGFLSIGHGYYLEDGTETNNRLYSNLGIGARAASQLVKKDGTVTPTASNPRKVPGILAFNTNGADQVPYDTDYAHPALFWSMNTWNDMQYNMAVGAETCGVCYWQVPGAISGGSQMEAWTGYASEQRLFDHAGTTPNQVFLGNTCVAASWAYTSLGDLYPCLGAMGNENDIRFAPIKNDLLPMPTRNPATEKFYPLVATNRFSTVCDGETNNADCSTVKKCSDGDLGKCAATVVDQLTSSFNATETNFAAVWLRPQWSLYINSAMTDVLNGGLSFVTGGGYTRAEIARGLWMLARKNVFVGNLEDPSANPYASNGGPFNPMSGLKCDNTVQTNYCLSAANLVDLQRSNFGLSERFFSIYDGPSFQDADSFLDITKTDINDCDLKDPPGPRARCSNSAWMEGTIAGLPGVQACFGATICAPSGCYLPNAAIAWKQPNGFYYPPSFHSLNLFFNNVDIRHYVIEPFFESDPMTGKRIDNQVETSRKYCNGTPNMFSASFSDVDRQTELSDDDGTLTGLTGTLGIPTISVNQDKFFVAPSQDVECKSDIAPNTDGTATTSPYEYITTALLPDFATTGAFPAEWSQACTNQTCFGVPMYRSYLKLTNEKPPPIRLSGQSSGQRSSLTANNGIYFIDTTTTMATQVAQGGFLSVFQEKQKYHVYILFANKRTNVTYQIFVGPDFDIDSVQMEKALINGITTGTSFKPFASAKDWPTKPVPSYDKKNGILTVNLNMNFQNFNDGTPGFLSDLASALPERCQPASMCSWNSMTSKCECNLTDTSNFLYNDCHAKNSAGDDAICSWGVKDIDFPDFGQGGAHAGGAYGFSFTLPTGFQANGQGVAARTGFAEPTCFPNDAQWKVTMVNSGNGLDCPTSPPPAPAFCP